MERKFKVGERVKDKSTGLSCDVVYVHEDSDLPYLIVGKTTGGVCINWRRSEQIELIPIKKLPEPKFNPYDKVRVNIKNFTPFNAEVTAWFICGDHYIYELKTEDGGTFQSKGEGVELIEPKYKKGDKVWNKTTSSVWEFVGYREYKGELECLILFNETKCLASLLSIEPYTGQDKVKEETQKERNSRLAAELIAEVTRLHPELKQVRSGKFLYNPNRKNVFSIDLVKEFKFNSPPYIWIETWDGTQFSIEDTDGKIKERIIKWTEE